MPSICVLDVGGARVSILGAPAAALRMCGKCVELTGTVKVPDSRDLDGASRGVRVTASEVMMPRPVPTVKGRNPGVVSLRPPRGNDEGR